MLEAVAAALLNAVLLGESQWMAYMWSWPQVVMVLPLTPSLADAGATTEGDTTEAMIGATTEGAMGAIGTTEASISASAVL